MADTIRIDLEPYQLNMLVAFAYHQYQHAERQYMLNRAGHNITAMNQAKEMYDLLNPQLPQPWIAVLRAVDPV